MKGFSHKVRRSSPCDFTQVLGFSHKVLRLLESEGFSHKVLNIYVTKLQSRRGRARVSQTSCSTSPPVSRTQQAGSTSTLVQHRQAMFHHLRCFTILTDVRSTARALHALHARAYPLHGLRVFRAAPPQVAKGRWRARMAILYIGVSC